MTRLIFIRHGFSCGNKEKRFSGQMDLPLDDAGYAQAEQTARYVTENYSVDAIYSSDLCRAYDTVKPISKALGLKVNKCRELREVDVGFWQGMLIEDVKKKYPESFKLYKEKPGLAEFDGGESYEKLLLRVKPAVEKIVSENDSKTVVIATHGGVIRTLRSVWENVPLSNIEKIPHVPNASITEVEYDQQRTRLVKVGYTEHLDEKITEAGVR